MVKKERRITRQNLRWKIMTMTAALLIALVAAACDSATGGGWLRSANTLALTE